MTDAAGLPAAKTLVVAVRPAARRPGQPMCRRTREADVLSVGAGPAGLAAAIRLTQLAAEHQKESSVGVLDRGSEVGAHIPSGAVTGPRALDELMPDWRE